MKTNQPEPCPGPEPCGHTDEEHEAFDTGLAAGNRGDSDEAVPAYEDPLLRLAWLTGWDVGHADYAYGGQYENQ